jgi:hypothetical protein
MLRYLPIKNQVVTATAGVLLRGPAPDESSPQENL